jgi:hypothetical protein
MEERKDKRKEKDIEHVEWGTGDKRLVEICINSRSTNEKEHSKQKRD